MNNSSIRTRIKQTVQFCREHPTLTASAATAIVVGRYTRKSTLEMCARQVGAFIEDSNRQLGVLDLQNEVMRTFISEKGLKTEFLEDFIPGLNVPGLGK